MSGPTGAKAEATFGLLQPSAACENINVASLLAAHFLFSVDDAVGRTLIATLAGVGLVTCEVAVGVQAVL